MLENLRAEILRSKSKSSCNRAYQHFFLLLQTSSCEERTNLGICSAGRFRYTEVCVDKTEKTRTSPEETSVVAPVPSGRVDHVRSKDIADDGNNVVCSTTESDSLDRESSRSNFTNQGIGNGTAKYPVRMIRVKWKNGNLPYSALVEDGPDQHERTSSQTSFPLLRIREQTHEAHDQESDEETRKTNEDKLPSTEPKSHKTPGAKDTDHVDGVLSHSEVVRDGTSETSLLKEVGTLLDH